MEESVSSGNWTFSLEYPTTDWDLKDHENVKYVDFRGISRFKNRIDQDKIQRTLKSATALQTRFVANKLALRCHEAERRRKSSARRQKIVQRIQSEYNICLDRINEGAATRVVKEIIDMERKIRDMDRQRLECRIEMVTRLLDEQRKKHRVPKPSFPPQKRKLVPKQTETNREFVREDEYSEKGDENEAVELIPAEKPIEPIDKKLEVNKNIAEVMSLPKALCMSPQRHEVQPEAVHATIQENIQFLDAVLADRRAIFSVPGDAKLTDDELKFSPAVVIFQDFEEGKTYKQHLKITNVGRDRVRCRYLGVHVEEFRADTSALEALIENNACLCLGLSISVQIQLRTYSTEKEICGHLVFETKRKNRAKASFLHVPVHCVPARAAVTVKPLKIIFPYLSWSKANSPEGIRLLRRTLKIENKGGKACACRISKDGLEPAQTEEKEIENFDEEDASEAAENILNELVENVFDTFRYSEKYFIQIPAFGCKEIDVFFRPKYKGFHKETNVIQFEGCHNLTQETLELSGDIMRAHLHTEPSVMDLKTCIVNSGVYQGTFHIINDSPAQCPVVLSLPKSMKNHGHVYPSSAIIPPLRSSLFSIKFYPKASLMKSSPRYYSDDTHVLEFPVFIRPTAKGFCWADRLKMYVLALLTESKLDLTPAEIDFGTVTTVETSEAELLLTNQSLSAQEFGFSSLPRGVRIEPNFGFGTILPGESIPLRVLYSPTCDMIQGNLVGIPGLEGPHHFIINVNTVAESGTFDDKGEEFSGHAQGSGEDGKDDDDDDDDGIDDEKEDKEMTSKEPEQYNPKEEINQPENCLEIPAETLIRRRKSEILKFLQQPDRPSELSFFERVKKEPDAEKPVAKKGENHQKETFRKNAKVVLCTARICDALCELSSSVIQLCPTPCSSYSLTRFRLNGWNSSTRATCHCGLLDKAEALKFQAHFEFQTDLPQIKLEPQSGYLNNGESIAVTIVFRPEQPTEHIRHESKIVKAERIFEGKKAEALAGKPKAPPLRAKGKKGQSEAQGQDLTDETIDLNSLSIQKLDLFAAERNLQQLMSPFVVKTKITCLIKILGNGSHAGRTETHSLLVIGPVVKPDFVYVGESQEIDFGKVAVGITQTMKVAVQNILLKPISPALSIFNPIGPFSCPNVALRVDPEHIWSQRITFAPSGPGLEKEFFEIRSGRTILHMCASGEGVDPQLTFKPDFAVNRMEAKKGSFTEFKIDLENQCCATLPVKILQESTKEALVSAALSANTKLLKTLPEITPEILTELEDFQKPVDLESSVFSLVTPDGNNLALIPPSGKLSLKIKFSPPTEEGGELADVAVILGPQGGKEKPPEKKYSSWFKVQLGNNLLREWIFIGTVTGGGKK